MNPILYDFPDSFDTKRLTIRSPRPGDGASLHAALEDTWDRLRTWFEWAVAPAPPSLADTEAQIRQAHAAFLERRDMRLLLFLKGTETCIGSSGLHRIDWSVPRFEVGYWVRGQFEGRGYVTEAVNAITAFAFGALGAVRVEIRMDSLNERSASVAERCGFELEGNLRAERRHHLDGTLRDTLIYARSVRDGAGSRGAG